MLLNLRSERNGRNKEATNGAGLTTNVAFLLVTKVTKKLVVTSAYSSNKCLISSNKEASRKRSRRPPSTAPQDTSDHCRTCAVAKGRKVTGKWPHKGHTVECLQSAESRRCRQMWSSSRILPRFR